MRLTFGEVALSLGCGPDTVIWEDRSDAAPRQVIIAQPAPSLSALARSNRSGNGNPGTTEGPESQEGSLALPWSNASWSGLFPTGAQVDSRKIAPGNIFFCLPGEHADGHEFAFAAAKAGAGAIVASHNPFWDRGFEKGSKESLPPVFLVDNPLTALWRLAICHRDTSLARVIGITGTAGKTSVKEVLAQVLAVRGQTARNPMNFNNQIGLPISMLNASADASFWVMEAGISEAHDMDELGAILRPDIAVILNVGDAHVAGLGEKGVAHNKALFLDYVLPGGIALVSADYPDLGKEAEKRSPVFIRRDVEFLQFSTIRKDVFCRADYEGIASGTTGRYRVFIEGRECAVEAPFRGEFGSENVAAIFAAASKLGLTFEEITQGFAAAEMPGQRFSCQQSGNFMLVDDSYNANPLSARRMVEAVRSMAVESHLPLILVMGEMLELGEKAQSAHEALGSTMAAANPELVFWKGGHAEAVHKGLAEAGYTGKFYPISGGQEFLMLLEESSLKNGLVLFKGSRGNHLERLVDTFRECMPQSGEDHAV